MSCGRSASANARQPAAAVASTRPGERLNGVDRPRAVPPIDQMGCMAKSSAGPAAKNASCSRTRAISPAASPSAITPPVVQRATHVQPDRDEQRHRERRTGMRHRRRDVHVEQQRRADPRQQPGPRLCARPAAAGRFGMARLAGPVRPPVAWRRRSSAGPRGSRRTPSRRPPRRCMAVRSRRPARRGPRRAAPAP